MKTYRLKKNTPSYNLIGDSLVETEYPYLLRGSVFIGQLVYIPMGKRLVPMVKVSMLEEMDAEGKKQIYYKLRDIIPMKRKLVVGVKQVPLQSDKETISSIDGYPQYADVEHSGADGLFRKIFGKKKEVTEEEMKKAHKDSGSKKSFGEWIKTEEATDLANNLLGIAFGKKVTDNELEKETTPPETKETEETDDNGETKILGMHPLTFGIASVSLLVVLGIGITLLKSKK